MRYVSVSRFCRFWTGERYLPLAPTPDMLKIADGAEYEKAYRERILAKLDPQKVYADLGDNAVLLCYEKWDDVKAGGKCCHRRIYAPSRLRQTRCLERGIKNRNREGGRLVYGKFTAKAEGGTSVKGRPKSNA